MHTVSVPSRSFRGLFVLLGALAISALASCASVQTRPKATIFADFARIAELPLKTREDGWAASRITEELADAHALDRMTRLQVMNAIGRGAECVEHRVCAQRGFKDSDWYYEVGRPASDFRGTTPILIVGFDHHGEVERVWNLRTHPEKR